MIGRILSWLIGAIITITVLIFFGPLILAMMGFLLAAAGAILSLVIILVCIIVPLAIIIAIFGD